MGAIQSIVSFALLLFLAGVGGCSAFREHHDPYANSYSDQSKPQSAADQRTARCKGLIEASMSPSLAPSDRQIGIMAIQQSGCLRPQPSQQEIDAHQQRCAVLINTATNVNVDQTSRLIAYDGAKSLGCIGG